MNYPGRLGIPILYSDGVLVTLHKPNVFRFFRVVESLDLNKSPVVLMDEPCHEAVIEHVDDAFELPLRGLAKLALEELVKFQEK